MSDRDGISAIWEHDLVMLTVIVARMYGRMGAWAIDRHPNAVRGFSTVLKDRDWRTSEDTF
jgi:hypothetical protein